MGEYLMPKRPQFYISFPGTRETENYVTCHNKIQQPHLPPDCFTKLLGFNVCIYFIKEQ